MKSAHTPQRPYEARLKPAPSFLLKRHHSNATDYDIFCRAHARLTWDNMPATAVFRRFLGWFYRFAPDAAQALRAHGASTSRALGRSLPGQMADMVRLANRAGISPREYYEFGLARFGGSDKLRDFIAHTFYYYPAAACARRRLLRFADPPNLVDKLVFERHCAALGAPSVETLAVIGADGVTDIHGNPCKAQFGDGDLFVKPRRGQQGRGTLRFASLGSGLYGAADGTVFSGDALLAHLATLPQSRRTGLLLQRALQNGAELRTLAGSALATLRIITIMNEADEPEVVYAALRTAGAAESIVDNYHARGIAFSLDIETGEIGAGRRISFADDPRFFQKHPVTGADMAGMRLTGWQEARSLALRLHEGSRHLLLAGWDIAITEDGPRAVEVNVPPGLPIVQMQRGFLGTRYAALLAMHIRAWLDDRG